MHTGLLDKKALVKKLTALLRASDVLTELTEEEIRLLARQAQFETRRVGEVLVGEGDYSPSFYFVLEGQVRLLDNVAGEARVVGYRFEGDFGGEIGLLMNGPQPVTEEVAVDTMLAVFDESTFAWLVTTAPDVSEKLKGRETFLEKKDLIVFEGQSYGEAIAQYVGRHFVAFLSHLPGPLLLVILGTLGSILLFNVLGLSRYFLILPACLVGLGLLLVVYVYLDWRNDNFIITSERVIHIERILLHGETRQEAPLTSIQDVSNIVPGVLAKIFDYSDLHIKTAGAGTIIFDGMKDADMLRDEIFRQRQKARERVEASDVDTVRGLIKESIGVSPEEGQKTTLAPVQAGSMPKPQSKLPRAINFYIPRVMEVEGETITWRKNYVVFLKLVAGPLLAGLAVVYLTLAAQFGFFPFANGNATLALVLLLSLPVILLWYSYQYDTWRKDVYRVTRTAIIDYEGSAFNLQGEKRRVGTFDVIQNSTYLTPNFLAKLLNVGHVVIETAGTEMTFTFKWVYNPSAVQQEIFKRWLAYKETQIAQDRAYEEQRLVRWIGEFYDLLASGEIGDKNP